MNWDDSQSNPHPQASTPQSQNTNTGPDDAYDVVTGVHEEIKYCSHSTSSGKQKKNRCKSQPQFGSGNTPATIEADKDFVGPSAEGEQQQFFSFS